jgi:glyoxylate/hydroxypyruvate reductase A
MQGEIMPTLLFVSEQDPPDLWLPALREALPEVEVRQYPDMGDPEDIDYTLVYWPPKGLHAQLPNLKLIHSIAAGIDHIVADPDLPVGVPIVRMVDDYLRDMMSEYAVYAVLHFHREFPAYREQQLRSDWHRGWPLYTPETDVGILGIGAIGSDVARKIGALGFRMHGWSRRPRQVEGVTSYHGEDGLHEMLGKCRYVVCVLPLTDETRGIVNANTLAAMPKGSYLINIARGGHVVDDDLLAALDSGHIAGAFLDVFNQEPLPAEHPYWLHPKVWTTPHVAGELVPRSCVLTVARHIRAHMAGDPVDGVLDRTVGY